MRLPIGSSSSETIFGAYSTLSTNDNRTDQFIQWWQPTSNPEISLTTEYWDWFQQIAVGANEDRRANWLEYLPTEGKTLLTRFTEHSFFNVPLIHLTQMMLIRAECYGELEQNKDLAIADINAIRNRAGITSDVYMLDPSAATYDDVVNAARNEYRKETLGMGLWVEQLQRRGAMGEDITIRGAAWDCPGMALQVSASEGNVAGFEFNEVGGCNNKHKQHEHNNDQQTMLRATFALCAVAPELQAGTSRQVGPTLQQGGRHDWRVGIEQLFPDRLAKRVDRSP